METLISPLRFGLTCILLLLLSLILPDTQAAIVKASAEVAVSLDGLSKTDAKKEALKLARNKVIARALAKNGRGDAAGILQTCPMSTMDNRQAVLSYRKKSKIVEGRYILRIMAQVDLETVTQHLQHCAGNINQIVGFVVVARQQVVGKSATPKYLNETNHRAYKGNIASGLKQVFNSRGFKVASGLEMELRSDGLYKKGRLVSSYERTGLVNWQSAADAGLISGMNYLTMGTVDIAPTFLNPVNGKARVNVTANLDMADLLSRELVAAAHNVSFDAEADTEDEAVIAAVNLVSRAAANQLADQLQTRKAHQAQ